MPDNVLIIHSGYSGIAPERLIRKYNLKGKNVKYVPLDTTLKVKEFTCLYKSDYISREEYVRIFRDTRVLLEEYKAGYEQSIFEKEVLRGMDLFSAIESEIVYSIIGCLETVFVLERLLMNEGFSRIILIYDNKRTAGAILEYARQMIKGAHEILLYKNKNQTISKIKRMFYPVKNIGLLLYEMAVHMTDKNKLPVKVKGRKILIYGYTRNHLRAVGPLISKINENTDIVSLFVFGRWNTPKNISTELCGDYMPWIKMLSMIDIVKIFPFYACYLFFGNKPRLRKNILHRDFNVLEYVNAGNEILLKSIITNLYQVFCVTKKLIRGFKPSLGVVMNIVDWPGRVFCHICRIYGIKTLYLPHASMSNHPMFWNVLADMTAASGEGDVDLFVSRGNDAGKFTVTGRPMLDGIKDKVDAFKMQDILNEIGIIKTKPIALVITQPYGKEISKQEYEEYVRCVFETAKRNTEIFFVVKIHPVQDGIFEKNIAEEMGSTDIMFVKDIDIFKVIYASDVVIIYFSSVGLDAMLLDKPVIAVNLGKKPDFVDYVASGAALGVSRREEMGGILKKAVCDDETKFRMKAKRDEFIRRYAYKIDGNSTNRVINLINSMAD